MTRSTRRLSGLAAGACTILTASFAFAAPPGPLPFGAYDPEGDFTDDPEVSIEHVFMPWEDVDLTTLIAADRYAMERGRALLITIEPWTWTRDERNTAAFLQHGIEMGYYDANMRAICSVIGQLESSVSVRWAHEMETDGDQFIWMNWEPADYIKAYRRVVEICRAEAPQASMMWSPAGFENARNYYPGDDYVDLVGLSVFGYEPWEVAILGAAQSYDTLLRARYGQVEEFDKPIVVAELGYSGSQAYVDAWEAEVRQDRPDLPLLLGVVYFDQEEVYPWPDGFGRPDWRLAHRVLRNLALASNN